MYVKRKLTEEQFIKINLELTKELEPIQNKLEEIDFQLKCSQNKTTLRNQVKDIIKSSIFWAVCTSMLSVCFVFFIMSICFKII